MPQIIKEIEKLDQQGKLEWQDEEDSQFFLIAMQKCATSELLEEAKALYNLIMKGSNRRFLVNNFDEGLFL